jgi:hypothetical protein
MNTRGATKYAMREYGVTAEELANFYKRVLAHIAKDRKAGKFHEYHGDIEALFTQDSDDGETQPTGDSTPANGN